MRKIDAAAFLLLRTFAKRHRWCKGDQQNWGSASRRRNKPGTRSPKRPNAKYVQIGRSGGGPGQNRGGGREWQEGCCTVQGTLTAHRDAPTPRSLQEVVP